MSLVSFVELPDVAAKLKPFRGTPQRAEAELLVPSSGNPQLAGTAFDYLLRFELKRRAPHAKDRKWVAEGAPFLLTRRVVDPNATLDPEAEFALSDRSMRVDAVCRSARKALRAYLKVPTPTAEAQKALAAWAVRLAKIDAVVRGRGLDPTFEDAAPELAEELVDLLAAVPYERLLHDERMILNPDFGDASCAVGGADADLITGDTLVDFKTTTSCEVWGNHIDQLFGYFLLARRSGLPAISKVMLYFARHRQLRVRETAVWTSHPDFAETERWFFERAREVFGEPVKFAHPVPRKAMSSTTARKAKRR